MQERAVETARSSTREPRTCLREHAASARQRSRRPVQSRGPDGRTDASSAAGSTGASTSGCAATCARTTTGSTTTGDSSSRGSRRRGACSPTTARCTCTSTTARRTTRRCCSTPCSGATASSTSSSGRTTTARRPEARWPTKHDTILVYVKDPAALLVRLRGRRPRAVHGAGARHAREGRARQAPDRRLVAHDRADDRREKTGYPTQKPEGILRRIIQASSRPGDRVLDFFAGSGTTGAVASALGRDAVLVDDNPEAIAVMRARMPHARSCRVLRTPDRARTPHGPIGLPVVVAGGSCPPGIASCASRYAVTLIPALSASWTRAARTSPSASHRATRRAPGILK